jgi:hypothetical protein
MVRVWPVWHSVDWRPAVLDRLRVSGRWDAWCDLVARADEVAGEATRIVVPPPAVGGRLFLRHWQAEGSSPEIACARRGFTGLEELGGAVARFFAFDVRRGRADVTAH